MSASIPNEREITAGTVVTKGPYYYIVMTWYEPVNDESGKTKKKTKWFPTKISVKEQGGKTRAKDLLLLVRVAFDKNNPDRPISALLSPEKPADRADAGVYKQKRPGQFRRIGTGKRGRYELALRYTLELRQ